MEIWIFNHYAIGPGQSGGTRHYDLAKKLVEKGHKVKIFASSFNHQNREETKDYKNTRLIVENIDGIEFVWIKTHKYTSNSIHRVVNMLDYSFKASIISKHIDGQPDLVIGSLVHPMAALVGYYVSKHKKSLFYFEERDLWPQTLVDMGKLKESNPIIKTLAKIELFLFNKADKIIVLFDKATGYVASKGIGVHKVLYLPNGVDLKRTEKTYKKLPIDVENILEHIKNNNDKIISIYTGAHGLANNLDVILNVAKKLENDRHEFIFIGNGPEKERLTNRVKNENIDNVTMFNSIDKQFIPTILQEVNLGLLPLKNSPVFKWGISPNKMFDYMSNKLPVVLLCDLDGSPVEKGKAGFIIKEDFEENLYHLFDNIDKNKLVELGINARQYVEKEHNWDYLSDKLLDEVYTDVELRNND